MSTDALREERLINILMRVEKEMGCAMTVGCIADIKREFAAALAAPASETENLPALEEGGVFLTATEAKKLFELPANWREQKNWHGDVYAAELEAALNKHSRSSAERAS